MNAEDVIGRMGYKNIYKIFVHLNENQDFFLCELKSRYDTLSSPGKWVLIAPTFFLSGQSSQEANSFDDFNKNEV